MNFIDANRMSNKIVDGATNNNDQLWHQHRLGHMGKSKFLELKKNKKSKNKNKQMVDDINLINSIILNENICEACLFGKQARSFFSK